MQVELGDRIIIDDIEMTCFEIRKNFSGVTYIAPRIIAPAFNGKLILACSIPLAALVMGAENAQAMGVLRAEGYDVPYNGMTVVMDTSTDKLMQNPESRKLIKDLICKHF